MAVDYNFSFSFINICYAGIIVVLIPWLFNVHHHFEAYVYGLGMAFSGGGAVIAALIFGGKSGGIREDYWLMEVF